MVRIADAATVLALMTTIGLPGTAMAGGVPKDDLNGTPAVSDAGVVRTGLRQVRVTPGVPTAVRVSLGHMNRFVLPFQHFDIWTASREEFQTRGNVFYIAPADEAPITLFVTPEGQEAMALNITLLPEAVPPTEVSLVLENAEGVLIHPASLGGTVTESGTANGTVTALSAPAPSLPSRESGPYEDGLAEMLTRFAAGEIPAGYSTGSLTATHPRCRRVGGLQADFSGGQRFLGAAFDVFVGVVRNDGPTGASFDESWCADPSVAAVALWPAIQLAPGGLAEIFVVRRRAGASGAAAGSLPARPSLIGGR